MKKMIIKSEKYEIELMTEESYTINSTDNLNFYKKQHLLDRDYYESIGLRVYEYGVELSSAIIGADGCGIGVNEDSLILQNSQIVICCANSVLCLAVPSLDLVWRTPADFCTCIGIFEHNESYIIHGENYISRLDLDGGIMWQQSGRDIFVTEQGTDFELTESYIKAVDFGNSIYKWNFDGVEIK